MPQAGDCIADRYRLTHWVATGGMGEIWAAVDVLLDRTVAIKLVRADGADDASFNERLLAEARAAAAVRHPGVVSIYDVGEVTDADGRRQSYIVMELLPGRSLAARLAEGPLSVPEVQALLAHVGLALAAAHERGVVHRDIKPANLMLGPDGTVTVLDFGIARAAQNAAVTATGVVFGTARYLSPEQAAGNRATVASDVYSLGVVAHQALTGVAPFDAESDVAIALAHLNEPPPRLPDWVPAGLADLIDRCLAKRPEQRPTAEAVAAAASEPDSLGAAATPAVAAPTVPLAVGAGGVDDTVLDTSGVAPGREALPMWLSPSWLAGYAAAGVALIAVIAVLAAGGSDGQTPVAGSNRPSASSSVTPATDVQHVHLPAGLVGQRWQVVRLRLIGIGLKPHRQNRDGGLADRVVSVLPAGGRLRPGQDVTVVVTTGPQQQATTPTHPVAHPTPPGHVKPAKPGPQPHGPKPPGHGPKDKKAPH